ncbi:MAG: DUF2199 domain-containing protein [Deltaproteobacteria bacterium]|nr:DUF2199 domain-containing protein [Deltaproteobacteria bacterium]
MRCETCGEEHALLDPAFRRPDAVVLMPPGERAERVKEDDDLCAIRAAEKGKRHWYYVRCVLPVRIHDRDEVLMWGIWAEVSEEDFERVVDHWEDPAQERLPAMEAKLANTIPGYPPTVGLPVHLRLTGPATRPELVIAPEADHPFATLLREGVDAHTVAGWMATMGGEGRGGG